MPEAGISSKWACSEHVKKQNTRKKVGVSRFECPTLLLFTVIPRKYQFGIRRVYGFKKKLFIESESSFLCYG